MSAFPHTTKSLADELAMHPNTLRAKAKVLGIGIQVGGRHGFRYSEADRQALIDSMRPAQIAPRRRRRRAA